MNSKYQKIFEPIKIGQLLVKNRIETSPAAPRLALTDGTVSNELIEWTRELAKGGAGIVTVGISQVTPPKPHNGYTVNMGDDKIINSLSVLADTIHRYGAKASIELAGFAGHEMPKGQSLIDMMSQEDISQWINYFALAAQRAQKAGMDMIMLHGGHGILISNFFSPLFNHRTDCYGGSLQNRARFASELLEAIREKTDGRLAIEYRLSADELVPGGTHLDETFEFAALIEDKIDLLHVSAGMLLMDDLLPVTTQPTYYNRGYNVHYAAAFKNSGFKKPVTAVGSIDLDLAAEILDRGDADICAMIRTVIADPYSVEKARTGKEAEIRPCVRCVLCLNRTHGPQGIRVACAVNPKAGRELELKGEPQAAGKVKKIAVIGGGPAGMEAARTAADRGHEVVLYEKSHELGGVLRVAANPAFKEDLRRYLDWSVRMTQQHPGIDIRLQTEANPQIIQQENFDALIVAVGAQGFIPPIPGVENEHIYYVGDVEAGGLLLGDTVIIAGGGLTGCETALTLARQGKSVTILEMVSVEEMIAVSPVPMIALLKLLREDGVTLLTGHKLIEIYQPTEICQQKVRAETKDGQIVELPFDSLVLAMGVKPKTQEAALFVSVVNDAILIGDCTTSRGTLYTATTMGFHAGLDV